MAYHNTILLMDGLQPFVGQSVKLRMLVERIFIVPKRFFEISSFFNDAIADGILDLLNADKTAL